VNISCFAATISPCTIKLWARCSPALFVLSLLPLHVFLPSPLFLPLRLHSHSLSRVSSAVSPECILCCPAYPLLVLKPLLCLQVIKEKLGIPCIYDDKVGYFCCPSSSPFFLLPLPPFSAPLSLPLPASPLLPSPSPLPSFTVLSFPFPIPVILYYFLSLPPSSFSPPSQLPPPLERGRTGAPRPVKRPRDRSKQPRDRGQNRQVFEVMRGIRGNLESLLAGTSEGDLKVLT
jgi:hypothetical protein